ncbi:hypothetical protein KL925_004229 [Ogataea polymorpha]|nr:hypothetical protein KL925_004229 [Ogataea polymorpha]
MSGQTPLMVRQVSAAGTGAELASRSVFGLSTALSTFLGALVLAWAVYKCIDASLLRFLVVPPHNYRDAIARSLEKGAIPESVVGIKHSSFRRRLVLAAHKPQLYSTMKLNRDSVATSKLRLARVDKDDPHFVDRLRPADPVSKRRLIFGYFHPFSDANGGGERVLWEAVYYTLKQSEQNVVAIYTFTAADDVCVSSLLQSVRSTFGIDLFADGLNDRIVFIQLNNRYKWLIDGGSWKHLTIIGQALGSIFVCFSSLTKLVPDVFIDTQGLPFCYPLVALLHIPVVAYVHYPLISSDMLNKLSSKSVYILLKYVYWTLMMKLYQLAATFIDCTLCNSTWTCDHIRAIWGSNAKTSPQILYPPTGIEESRIADPLGEKDRVLLYLAQFRPEKRHRLLLKEFAKYARNSTVPFTLALVGSTRSKQDEETVRELKLLAEQLEISSLVAFEVNAPRKTVDEYLSRAAYGLNVMWNEHFGISVVEYMLNGAIPIVHASAGPLLDIVLPVEKDEVVAPETKHATPSGFFFADPSDPDYKGLYPSLNEVLLKADRLDKDEAIAVRKAGQLVAQKKFAKEVFGREWTQVVALAKKFELEKRQSRNKVEMVY